MEKQCQLKKFGLVIKNRRSALRLSTRELSQSSGVSAALISKLENGLMNNFPKKITIEHLSKALKFKNELYELADILFERGNVEEQKKRDLSCWQEQIRTILATSTNLSAENIDQSIFFIQGIELLQEMKKMSENS